MGCKLRIHIGNVDERSRPQMSVANLRIATTLLQLAAYYHVEIQLRHCWNLLMIQKLESWVYIWISQFLRCEVSKYFNLFASQMKYICDPSKSQVSS